jgi:16S rRNA processing protein RimM
MTLDECFELGFIVKPHALKGQMTAQLDVDDAATYDKLKTVYLALATAPTKLTPYQVERVNPERVARARRGAVLLSRRHWLSSY